jgi:hypothetical protein
MDQEDVGKTFDQNVRFNLILRHDTQEIVCLTTCDVTPTKVT